LLPAAQAAAQSPVARFEVGRLQLQIGQGTQDRAMQQQAVDAMLASNGAPATVMATLLGARASLAIQASDWATADQMLTRYLELDGSNVERLRQAAEVKIALQRNAEALTIYQRLLQVQDTANQTPTQEVINRAIALAADQRNAALVDQLTQRLLRSYPNTDSWRTALIRLRQNSGQDQALGLDVRRLMRTAGVFARSGDYVEFVSRLNTAGQPGEAKAVLEDGIARGTLSGSDPEVRQLLTAATTRAAEDRAGLPALRTRAMAAPTGREARIAGDTFYAHGQYAAAAELYRAALQKGGEDANLLNTRLGAALAGARQTAEAQAAFRAVTGPRQPLASYWLMWLERPATAAAPATPAAAPNQQ
jgi:Tfp pilus assembly protein PilF